MPRKIFGLLLAASLGLVALPTSAQFLAAPTVRATRPATASPNTRQRRARVDWRSWRNSGVRSPSQPHPNVPTPAPAPNGQVACDVTENGVAAPATIEVRSRGRVIASGRCGTRIEVPGGTYSATVTLESAIDRPQQHVPLVVPSHGVGSARASFSTSIIEVRFSREGAPAFGQAVLVREGRSVGSIGHRNAVRISSGRVTVRARHRTMTQTFDLQLRPGQRRAIQARF